MASTPPPLPSSSEDEFDDDDFGCFSSAPMNPVCDISPTVEEKDFTEDDENYNNLKEMDFSKEQDLYNDDTPNRLDQTYSDSANENQTKSNGELLSTETLSQSHQLETNHSSIAPSHDPSPGHPFESQDDNVESIKAADNSLCVEEEGKIQEHITSDDNERQKNEIYEHSTNLSASPTHTDNISCDNLSSVDKDNPDQNQSDSNITAYCILDKVTDAPEIPDVPETTSEKKLIEEVKEEDDFGNWSDSQTFDLVDGDSADSKSPDTADHQNETILKEQTDDLNIDHSDNIIDESTVQDEVESAHDTKHSPGDNSPNIPFESDKSSDTPKVQNLSTDYAITDNQDEEDDDFGDFADFSSHQDVEVEGNTPKHESTSPLSFKLSPSNQTEIGDNDKDLEDSVDCKKIPEASLPSDSFATFDSKDAVVDNNDDWGFQSVTTGGNDEGDDNWDFASADNANDDDWAAFSETPGPVVASDNVDDFDDFNSCDFQTSSSSQNDSAPSKSQDSAGKVEKVISMCFPPTSSQLFQNNDDYDKPSDEKTSEIDDHDKPSDEKTSEIDELSSVIEMGLKITPKAKEETWTIVRDLRNKDPVVGTWGRLKDVNSCHALDYGWNNSHCCQEIFSTLHIDTQNVLFSQKKQAVPFYTSGLGILEPIRGGPNPAEKSQPSSQPNLLQTNSPEDPKKTLDIPPVDFDWGSSGLTNPLKVFKTENFNTGLSSLEPFSDVLQKSMEPTQELSTEAKSFLSKIPNLNFMRSNVLMFPIKD